MVDAFVCARRTSEVELGVVLPSAFSVDGLATAPFSEIDVFGVLAGLAGAMRFSVVAA